MKHHASFSNWLVVLALVVVTPALADPDNLRISRVDPSGNLVHVLNTGPTFTTSSTVFFCHRFQYPSIPTGTTFEAGETVEFSVTLHDTLSDLWLYKDGVFTNPDSMIHGVKYGGSDQVGRESVAVAAGLWPSTDAYTPVPPPGAELVWEGAGFVPTDWYVKEPFDPSPPSSQLAWPSGVQDFEALELGRPAADIEDWVSVDESELFTIRTVSDHDASNAPADGSTRWLRVRDQDDGGQNRFYSLPINAGTATVTDYTWQWHMALETPPPGGGAQPPRMTIQHDQQGLFQNAWGIEIADDGIYLIVLGIGGTQDRVFLESATTDEWMEVTLHVDFDAAEVSAQINEGTVQSLPIDLPGDADKGLFRYCYRGEGAGNVMQLLLDQLAFSGSEGPGDPVFQDRFEQQN